MANPRVSLFINLEFVASTRLRVPSPAGLPSKQLGINALGISEHDEADVAHVLLRHALHIFGGNGA